MIKGMDGRLARDSSNRISPRIFIRVFLFPARLLMCNRPTCKYRYSLYVVICLSIAYNYIYIIIIYYILHYIYIYIYICISIALYISLTVAETWLRVWGTDKFFADQDF